MNAIITFEYHQKPILVFPDIRLRGDHSEPADEEIFYLFNAADENEANDHTIMLMDMLDRYAEE